MTAPGLLMQREIDEQPDRLQDVLDSGLPAARHLAGRLREHPPRFVLFAARGTSDHACLYAKYLVEITLGLPAGMMSPSTLTAYGARPDLRDVLVVVVSQSGGSPDLLETARVAKECGATVLAVTNSPGSALAAVADIHLDAHAGAEHAVAATKSYTAQLLTLWLTVDAWRGGDSTAARDVPAAAAEQVRRRSQLVELAGRFRFAERLILTARGYSYPTAREGALKLMETSYLSAHAFSGADLLHGPLAMIDQGNPVLAVIPEGVGVDAMRPVLERLRANSADVTVLGGPTSVRPGSHDVLLGHTLSEELSPVVDVIALQQLAREMAVARGYDPDSPRGLSKVTETW
jgi:glucosamine--fructose-6-phosphate aminotransferase (isomerizing)